MVFPYIDINLPLVYMCSPSWTLTHLPPHTILLGHPSAPAPSFLYPASNLDWRLLLIWYYTCFNAILPNHPHLPPHTIPLGHPSVPVPSILYPASNLDWRFISYVILYMFQCHSSKSSHPLPLPQNPKDCSICLCLFCCLAYRVIVTIFLNSIYMH